jgi:hypothetical protein
MARNLPIGSREEVGQGSRETERVVPTDEDNRLRVSYRRKEETAMSSETLIIVIVLAFVLFGGGGGYYWSRRRR